MLTYRNKIKRSQHMPGYSLWIKRVVARLGHKIDIPETEMRKMYNKDYHPGRVIRIIKERT